MGDVQQLGTVFDLARTIKIDHKTRTLDEFRYQRIVCEVGGSVLVSGLGLFLMSMELFGTKPVPWAD